MSARKCLNAIGSGVLSGATEAEAAASQPEYVSALRLYRAGLLNSYDIPTFPNKEDKATFEKRVAAEITQILVVENEELKIIVSHRSSITATLIDFARRFHNYPQDFFGHVPLDLGRVSWIEESQGDLWSIRQVNVRWRDLGLE